MYEIRVLDSNGIEQTLDYFETSFPYTFEGASISDLQDQSVSWSYTIEIPRTLNNDKIFECAGLPYVSSRLPYRQLLCNVYDDGVLFIRKGTMFIDNTSDDRYEVQIISGQNDIFDLMGEIEFHNGEHAWDLSIEAQLPLSYIDVDETNMADINVPYVFPRGMYISYPKDADDGGIYPPLRNDYMKGNIFPYAMPLVRVGSAKAKGLLRRVLNDIGCAFETDTPQATLDNLWLNLVSRDRRYGIARQPIRVYNTSYYKHIPDKWEDIISASTDIDTGDDAIRNIIRATTKIPDQAGASGRAALEAFFDAGNELTIRAEVKIDEYPYHATLSYEDSKVTINKDNYTQFFKDGSTECEVELYVGNVAVYKQGTGRYGVFADLKDSNKPWNVGGSTYTGIETERTAYLLLMPEKDYAQAGEKINLEQNIGFDTAFDFFKALAQVFGWIVHVKQTIVSGVPTTLIQAHTFDYIVGRKNVAKDWSNKMIADNDNNTQYQFGDYAQRNNILLEENENYTDKGYTYWIDNYNLEREKDILEIGIIPEAYNYAVAWERNDDGGYSLNCSGQQMIAGVTGYREGEIRSYTSAMVAQNYKNLFKALQSVEVVQAKMLLSLADILTLDPYTPVYVAPLGGYYIVNKIDNWEDSKICNVELLRI